MLNVFADPDTDEDVWAGVFEDVWIMGEPEELPEPSEVWTPLPRSTRWTALPRQTEWIAPHP